MQKWLASTNISKVVVAIKDPDSRNSGKGIQILVNRGIKVEVGVAEKEVKIFLKQYLGKS